MKRKTLSGIAIILLAIGVVTILFAQQNSTTLFRQLKLLNTIITTLYTEYVDPIDYRRLIKGAIDGMLYTLDQHTNFLTKKQTKDLQVDTRGKFGGLGIQIGIKDGWLTVISPMEGTPAYRMGIQAGDKIIKIDGKSTKGITTDIAVSKLRGDPGTKVTITIEREGVPKPFDVTITREIIEIKPVPFYGLTDKGVGYLRLATFSEEAGKSVRNAVSSLVEQGAKGIILDLRGNPGGLLTQAVEVASCFLGEGQLVVYTQGRSTFQSNEYYTEESGCYPEGQLVVLVDYGSASASEIVAGAIQDHDRGLIMGEPTFGKGLVQSVRHLEGGTSLKITTAKYYVPSGRCIQKESYLKKPTSSIITDTTLDLEDVNEEEIWNFDLEADSVDTDTVKAEDLPTYYTSAGRVVKGGGGIIPDIKFEAPKYTKVVMDLERQSLFFIFAVQYTSKNKINSPDFEVDDAMIAAFKEFLKEKKFESETRAEEILDKIDTIALNDNYTEATKKAIQSLRTALKAEREAEFERSMDYIKKAIKREIVSKLWGESGRYKYHILKTDEEIARAEEIILNPEEYNNLFGWDKIKKGTTKPKQK